VTWTKLLANKEAQRHKTSKKELDNMRALIARDLADAGIAGLSADRRFATAYNAALQAANMAIVCAGYRIMSKVGHVVRKHETCVGQTRAQVRRLF
jgi:N-acyl-D-aspartate/D-glutamate deacylase